MRERQQLDDQIGAVRRLEKDLADNIELIGLGEAEGDKTIIEEAERGLKELAEEAERRQIATMLSGEADGNDTFLEVHAGAGGTESQDWAEMLMRMYWRWAEEERLQGRAARGASRRRGGHQVGDAARQGAERLWLAEDRVGRPPAGAHLAL